MIAGTGCPNSPLSSAEEDTYKITATEVFDENFDIIAPYTGQVLNFGESLKYVCQNKRRFKGDFTKSFEILNCTQDVNTGEYSWGVQSSDDLACTYSKQI